MPQYDTQARIDAIAAQFPTSALLPGGRVQLLISPGSVQVRFVHKREAWSERQDAAGFADADTWQHQLKLSLDPEAASPEPVPVRGLITSWSRKSRTNMVRTLAQYDYQPLLTRPGCRLAMLTLTYPGDWESLAPTAEHTKRHLRAMWAWLHRRGWGGGVWKLEFQRRGAPHVHMLVSVPTGRLADGTTAAQACGEAWARIVGATGLDGERHRRAGTRIDYATGARCTDPVRLATYFVKHAAPTAATSKEYQHLVPALWLDSGGAGRFWGVRGLRRAVAVVELDRTDALELLRTVRRWSRAQGRTYRAAPKRVVDQGTGEIRYRRPCRKRWQIRAAHNPRSVARREVCGRFVLVNDGPGFALQLAHVLAPRPGPRRLP